MKICNNCILPESFPGITFNARGICNHCQRADHREMKLTENKEKYKQKFFELLETLRIFDDQHPSDRYQYDVLMAYSGGKDSSYTMELLKNKYKLRVLAVSVENGFLSETALANIKRVTDCLEIDHIFFKPRWELLKRIFSASANRELYSKKTLERASTICTSCIGIVKSVCLKIAIEMDIPMICYGWSPGQAPVESSIMRNNPSFIRNAQQVFLKPFVGIAGEEIKAYFLHEKHYSNAERFPYNVHPLAWEFYSEEMVREKIETFGWTDPKDTDSNSTNCLLNAFANDIHIQRYRFHPYVWELANMVRDGVMSRDEGYKKIYQEQSLELVMLGKEKLFGNGRQLADNV